MHGFVEGRATVVSYGLPASNVFGRRILFTYSEGVVSELWNGPDIFPWLVCEVVLELLVTFGGVISTGLVVVVTHCRPFESVRMDCIHSLNCSVSRGTP